MAKDGDNVVTLRSGGNLLQERLESAEPARQSDVYDTISILLDAFPATPKSEHSAEIQIKAYAMAVEGFPFEPIQRAVKAFIRGEVEEHNRRFTPSSAELAAEVRRQFWVIEYEARGK